MTPLSFIHDRARKRKDEEEKKERKSGACIAADGVTPKSTVMLFFPH